MILLLAFFITLPIWLPMIASYWFIRRDLDRNCKSPHKEHAGTAGRH